MTTNILTAGILGLDANGQLLLETAHAGGHFHIQAVADPDYQKAEKIAAEFKCEAYTDYRQLIVRNDLDCLLVAADIHTCDDHLKTALKKKFNVLKLAPPARDFEEALSYVQIAESEKVRFAIANPSRFMTSYRVAGGLLERGLAKQVYLITAECLINDARHPLWHADPKLAGGGVLLHNCYQTFDWVLRSFPLPQQVYALTTNHAPDKQQRLYLTEDTAAVTLKFSDSLTGSLTAMRSDAISSAGSTLRIYGHEALLTVTDNEVVLRRHAEPAEQRWQFAETKHDVMARLLSSFATSLKSSSEHELVSSAAENLRNMAVLESAYLSARTGSPEEPARIPRITGAPAGTATSL